MTTEKQAAANKANAKKSTGPKTAAGKATVAGNAISHGILSSRLFLEDESPDDFQALQDDLRQALRPMGALELALVEKVAVALWKQRRLVAAETAMLELGRHMRRGSNRDDVKAALGLGYTDADITEEERAMLEQNVLEHGCRDPLVTWRGVLLDGHNRYKAAQEAGVAFETRMFEGTPVEAIERVWSLNRTRRHMTPSQAAIADARRNEMTDVYAAVRDAAKERHSIAVSESNKRRANAVPSGEQIPPMEDSLQLEDEKLLSQIDNDEPTESKHNTQAASAINCSDGAGSEIRADGQ